MLRVFRDVKFLITGPLILLMLFVINWMTSPGDWWVKWPALGIGIAWFIALFRVVTTAVAVGGLAALVMYLRRK